jgi:hypothetical protein
VSSFVYKGEGAILKQPTKGSYHGFKKKWSKAPAKEYSGEVRQQALEAGIVIPKVQASSASKQEKRVYDELADDLPWGD